jgi:ABC-type cobalamin transport system ATPase subunit
MTDKVEEVAAQILALGSRLDRAEGHIAGREWVARVAKPSHVMAMNEHVNSCSQWLTLNVEDWAIIYEATEDVEVEVLSADDPWGAAFVAAALDEFEAICLDPVARERWLDEAVAR